MPHVALNRHGIVAVVGQLVSAGMTQHVGINGEADIGAPASTSNHFPDIGIR